MGAGFVVDLRRPFVAVLLAAGEDGGEEAVDAVAPEALTAPLIETAAAVSAPTGFHLNIRIFAAAIQSAPDAAVQDAWGITPTNGELIPN